MSSTPIYSAMPSTPTPWKRRIAVMAILGLVVGLGVTLALGDSDDDERAQGNDLPTLGPRERDKGLKVKYQVPEGWKQSKESQILRLRSEDRRAQMAVSAPAAASESKALFKGVVETISNSYKKVEVGEKAKRSVGGLDSKVVVVSAKNEKGVPIRVLVVAASGKKRAYLVEVFTATNAPERKLAEAQLALGALRLKG